MRILTSDIYFPIPSWNISYRGLGNNAWRCMYPAPKGNHSWFYHWHYSEWLPPSAPPLRHCHSRQLCCLHWFSTRRMSHSSCQVHCDHSNVTFRPNSSFIPKNTAVLLSANYLEEFCSSSYGHFREAFFLHFVYGVLSVIYDGPPVKMCAHSSNSGPVKSWCECQPLTTDHPPPLLNGMSVINNIHLQWRIMNKGILVNFRPIIILSLLMPKKSTGVLL